jgi:hypothetical protein
MHVFAAFHKEWNDGKHPNGEEQAHIPAPRGLAILRLHNGVGGFIADGTVEASIMLQHYRRHYHWSTHGSST